MKTSNLFDRAFTVLMECDTDRKLEEAGVLNREWSQGLLIAAEDCIEARPTPEPGRPDKPPLVKPQRLKSRKISSPEGLAALIHALAHIEFNAINLALDAVYRFRGLPRGYYGDWLGVAADEAYHFRLLRNHLTTLGYAYGDFPAHNGLWDMAAKTAHDPLVRMALVPRVFEARGLDVTPDIRHRLASSGDAAGAAILDIILRDEIGHVAIGNRWYAYFCRKRRVDPISTFAHLLKEHGAPALRPPFYREARLAAGFSEEELRFLDSACPEPHR